MIRWAIITGEYPPQPGGVSDYTRLVARELAKAGDAVKVYTPGIAVCPVTDAGVEVFPLLGHYGPRSLFALDRLLSRHKPDRILVQYVPHAFGWKAMNLPFAAWVAARAWRLAPVSVMFHEVAFPFSWRPLRHAVLGGITVAMARLMASAADRVYVSIPPWGLWLKRLCPRAERAEWLPVPCTLPLDSSTNAVDAVRRRCVVAGESLVGHFGTFGQQVAALLAPTLAEFTRLTPTAKVLLIGRGSVAFRGLFVAARPELGSRILATGELSEWEIDAHLRACDLLLQPYPDGVSSRRTSAMASLACGRPLVTNLGQLSEPIWENASATISTPDPTAMANLAAELLAQTRKLAALGQRGFELYRGAFRVEHTIAKLRGKT